MKVRVGTGVLATDTTSTDVTWGGAGTPDAAIIIPSRATALNTQTPEACGGWGFTDFTTQAGVSFGMDDNVSPADNIVAHRSTLGLVLSDENTTNVDRSASISTITDGVRLSPQQSGTARAFMVIAFFGGEWSCFTQNLTLNTSSTWSHAHGLSGAPNLGFFGYNHAPYDNEGTNGANCMGFMTYDGTIDQVALMQRFVSGGSSGQNSGQITTDRCAGRVSNSAVQDGCLEVTTVDGTNVTFTGRDQNITSDPFIGLVGLVDETVEIAEVNSPNSAASDWNVNDASEQPQAVIGLHTRLTAVDTADNGDNAGCWNTFCITEESEQASVSWRNNDGSNPTENDTEVRSADIECLDNTGTTPLYKWDAPTFTADGFDVSSGNITNASTTTHIFPMMFIGQETATGTNPDHHGANRGIMRGVGRGVG